MEGGELFQRIQDRPDGAFTERGKIYGISEKQLGDYLNFIFRSSTGYA